MLWWRIAAGLMVAAGALLGLQGAAAQDALTIAVGARGVGETFVPELGQPDQRIQIPERKK